MNNHRYLNWFKKQSRFMLKKENLTITPNADRKIIHSIFFVHSDSISRVTQYMFSNKKFQSTIRLVEINLCDYYLP